MAMTDSAINKAILGFVFFIVLLKLYAVMVPEAQAAGNELNESGVPLGSFFVADGIVFLLIMVGLLILAVRTWTARK